jgi:hypothetical protein
MLRIYPSDDGNAAFVRLERHSDLLLGLREAAAALDIEAGTVQILGAVEELAVAYFRQDVKRFDDPLQRSEVAVPSACGLAPGRQLGGEPVELGGRQLAAVARDHLAVAADGDRRVWRGPAPGPRWRSWYRWVTLAIALVVVGRRQQARARAATTDGRPPSSNEGCDVRLEY